MIAYHSPIKVKVSGELSINVQGDTIVFDKMSLAEIKVSVGGNGSLPMRQGDKLEAKDGVIGEVIIYNPSATSDLDLEVYVTGNGVVSSSRIQLDGGVSTRKGNQAPIKNLILTSTRQQILGASISRNGFLARSASEWTLHNTELGVEKFTVPEGTAISLENGAEFWAEGSDVLELIEEV